MMPVLLWTDALIWLLVAVGIVIGVYVLRTPTLRMSWHKVITRPMGMASLVVLIVFVSLGLTDSLHYRARLDNGQYDVEVWSLLDLALKPLKEHTERTYSAPLATRAQAMEAIPGPGGTQIRDFPRLEFGGAYLVDPGRDWAGDVATRVTQGVGLGLLSAFLFAALLTGALAIRWTCDVKTAIQRIARSPAGDPSWHGFLVTVGVVLTLAWILARLAGGYHVLGTDKVGQDVFYQTLKSIRTGLVIGTLSTLVTLPLAIMLGLMAGYFRGWVDDVIQYLYTTLNSIPWVLLVAAAVLITQVFIERYQDLFDSVAARADFRLLALCVIIGLTGWTGLARLIRAETLKVRELDYVTAARAFGLSDVRILLRHVLPNVQHIILISVVMDFSGLVLAEAVLSYVGVGVDPVMNSWGNMINAARLELAREPVVWWPLAAAFVFMFALVLAANLFADAVRDAFDPRIAFTDDSVQAAGET
ncbi:MAG: ABC transporter permease [Thiobacillaceae bacterium]